MPQSSSTVIRLVTGLTATPLESRPPPSRVPSGRAAPEIAVEALEIAVGDLLPLLVRYHREVGDEATPELDPDWQALLRGEAMGQVLFVTARHAGALVGFALSVLYTHVFHRTTVYAQTHEYVDPAYRDGLFGLAFLKRNLEFLAEKNVKRAYIATPNERAGKVYERAGYAFVEAAYVRTL